MCVCVCVCVCHCVCVCISISKCILCAISVMLQPSMELSSVDKSKHKFMVQSMFAPLDFNSDNLDQMVCVCVCVHVDTMV